MSTRVRMTGLVKTADMVRRELAGPLSPELLERLKSFVPEYIRKANEVMRRAGAAPADLSAQSRKALEYLGSIDFGSVVASTDAHTPRFRASSVSFKGLKRPFEYVLGVLASSRPAKDLDAGHALIRRMSARIENNIAANGFEPQQLTPETRAMRGWFAYFSRRENFDQYCIAAGIAKSAFETVASGMGKKTPPALIHFRPIRGTYSCRAFSDALVARLPTPAFCFGEKTFAALAKAVFSRGSGGQELFAEMMSETYQSIQAEIEGLGGVAENAAGMVHDLAASFDRVNAAYFDGGMRRPRISWQRSFGGRKFGHYQVVQDILMVSCLLDSKAVPSFVVDFIVYHELLHKKHGIQWSGTRAAAHTPEFHQDERRFARYDEAKVLLDRMAKG